MDPLVDEFTCKTSIYLRLTTQHFPHVGARASDNVCLHHSPSVMRALLVRTFPSMNFNTARTLQRIPLKMETLNRKSS